MTQTRSPREASRDQETRSASDRVQDWKPPTLLPVPEQRDGITYRWVRTSSFGRLDNTNVSAKFREGWTPVLASDYPELKIMSDHDSRFPENIEVGGLLLCKCDDNIMAQRRAYQSKMAQAQLRSVDENFMRENDPRMPVLAPERSSRISRSLRE